MHFEVRFDLERPVGGVGSLDVKTKGVVLGFKRELLAGFEEQVNKQWLDR